MKKTLRSIAISALALLLLCSMAINLIGCNSTPAETETGSEGSESESQQNSGNKPSDGETTDPTKADYSVSVKTIGGRPIPSLTFFIYKGDDLVSYGQTDANGFGKVNLPIDEGYEVELSATSLEGYLIEKRYSFNGKSLEIVLESSVILSERPSGLVYKLGDIMYDFTVTTTDGSKFTLSEALKEKKGVLINFWYSTCSPCINEFPYMQEAYEMFSDDIEVIALNNYGADNEITVRDFKATMGLTFPVAKDFSTLGSAFSLQGYPTSIFIDRYGTICLVEIGGLTSIKPFVAAFEHFSAENYEQKLFYSIDELTPAEKPTVSMPSSDEIGAAVNGEGFSALYYPETESSDAEYSWPFLVGELSDGTTCIYNSNSFKDASFATIHADVTLKAGEAFAIDWFASSELGVDMLYILVNEKDIYRLSGSSTDWATCYPFVAVEDGEYKITFIYLKDDSTDVGEDKVYLKNFRVVSAEAVDVETFIPRQAATKPNANGLGYQEYITPVFNESDGYYHVGSENGPLLLVNLMSATQLNPESLNQLGYDGKLIDDQGDVYEKLVDYCNYAINGTLYGYSPITAELKDMLVRIADMIGYEADNPNQWLQACSYYDAYGTDKQLEDPVRGIAFFAAIETLVSTEDEIIYNTVTYDGRVIMPRGIKYKFVPTKSGAYLIKSQSDAEVDGWVFDENYNIYHTAAIVDRPYNVPVVDTTNVTMLDYFEAGKTYYIDIAYYDVYAAGSFTFTVEFISESYQQFHLASPGYFTFYESATGQINETIAGGIDVALGDDGYYHELRKDGTLGSIVYADFTLPTGIFSHSILAMIDKDGFNFALNETDLIVLATLEQFDGDVDACRNYYKELWGDTYAEWADIYKLEEVLAGIYHGEGEDLSDEIRAFADKIITDSTDAPELNGCVPVDEDLAKLLQALMDKYTFSGVRNSWTKLCYYYKTIGSTTVSE